MPTGGCENFNFRVKPNLYLYFHLLTCQQAIRKPILTRFFYLTEKLIVMIRVMMRHHQLFDASLFSHLNSLFIAAMTPPPVRCQLFRGLLRLMD